MKVKYGGMITMGSGKFSGLVAAFNKGGNYLRALAKPTNPSSTDQVVVRNNFTANSQGWKGLTAAQRKDWNSSVQNFKKTDQFGDIRVMSGFQLYVRLNNYLRFISETPITSPPVPASVPTFATFSGIASKTAGTCVMAFTPAIAATEKVIISATPGLSAGIDFVKSEYRKVDIWDSAIVTTEDLFTAYEAKFGTFPSIGTKIFFKAQQIVLASGLPGAKSSFSVVVV